MDTMVLCCQYAAHYIGIVNVPRRRAYGQATRHRNWRLLCIAEVPDGQWNPPETTPLPSYTPASEGSGQIPHAALS